MARRGRQDEHSEELVLWFIGTAVLLALFIPGGRRLIGIGVATVIISVGLAIVAGIFWWWFKREDKPSEAEVETTPVQNSNQLIATIQTTQAPRCSLIERVRAVDWYQFEKMVALAYRKSGFGVLRKGGANPDGGVDLIITDTAGKKTAIQCKQWRTWNVSVRIVREFLGALTDAGIQDGIIVTLRGYTGEAKQLANKHRIQLLNENDVEDLLKRAHAEYDPEILALLDDTRKFCPKCEREMILRTNKRGRNPGSQFWGCSAFPRCNFKMRGN
jgi:hypothetical protein